MKRLLKITKIVFIISQCVRGNFNNSSTSPNLRRFRAILYFQLCFVAVKLRTKLLASRTDMVTPLFNQRAGQFQHNFKSIRAKERCGVQKREVYLHDHEVSLLKYIESV